MLITIIVLSYCFRQKYITKLIQSSSLQKLDRPVTVVLSVNISIPNQEQSILTVFLSMTCKFNRKAFHTIFIDDKNELMKERMRLEKTKKNNEKTMEEDPKQKRKNDKDGTEEKKKKRKLGDEAQSSTETNQKAKEKEDRKKKKEEEQRRKNFLLETRKAQAAQRWSSIASRSERSTTKTTFSPVPLRNANNPQVHLPVSSNEDMSFTCTLPASHDVLQTNQPQANPPTSVQQTPSQHTTPSQCSSSTGSTTSRSLYRTPAQRTTASQSTPAHDTPKAPAGRKQCPDPRRGIHFQSALGDMGEDDDSEESDTECSGCVATESNSCGGCRELRIENEELRKRLEKVHKRLNIACKYFSSYII